jgi:hypothetical protein
MVVEYGGIWWYHPSIQNQHKNIARIQVKHFCT